MAMLQEGPRTYSTLERFQDDETVRAPQALGPATTAGFDNTPEVDGTISAPEVLPGTRPEVFYSTLPPEVVNAGLSDNFERLQDRLVGDNISPKRTKRAFVALALITVVVTLAIGLGIGLRRRAKPSFGSPATPIPPVLNDSSLAVIISANNDRNLFFQGPQGVIRRMIYSANRDQWIADPGFITISDAKDLTPLAVNRYNGVGDTEELELYYITKSNHIKTSVSSEKGWFPGGDISLDYTTDPDTRQLSITSTAGTNVTQGPVQSLLVYEDSGGNVATLLQVQEPGFAEVQGLYWLDITRKDDSIPRSDFSPVYFDADYSRISSTLHELLPGATLHAPFISGSPTDSNGPGLDVDLLLCNDSNDGNFTNKREFSFCNNVTRIIYHSWTNASRGYFLVQDDLGEFNSLNLPSTRSFDFAYLNTGASNADVLAVWVNGTKVSPVRADDYFDDYLGNGVPQASFPFTRLASTNSRGESSYLYHQINGTTLAEEQYDFSLHEWVTTTITVPNP